jgi:hypothetical protein
MIQRRDVARHLLDIVDGNSGNLLGLKEEQVREGRLGSLDLRRQKSLLSQIHVDKQRWRRQNSCNAIKSANRHGRPVQQFDEDREVDWRIGR